MWLGESMWLLEYERNMGKGRYRKMLVFAKTQEELDEHLDRMAKNTVEHQGEEPLFRNFRSYLVGMELATPTLDLRSRVDRLKRGVP